MTCATHAAGPSATETLCREHAVALRMWGRLQNELSAQLQRQAQERQHLLAQLMRLRAALLVTRTAVLWGLTTGATSPPRHAAAAPVPARPSEVDEVLCQTGCVGHAHHWLNDEQRCTRSGLACHRLG